MSDSSKWMKHFGAVSLAAWAAILCVGIAAPAAAQKLPASAAAPEGGAPDSSPPRYSSAKGTLIIPQSSTRQAIPKGRHLAAHTNIQIFLPHALGPSETPPFTGMSYETPASLACHYGFVATAQAPNCNPNSTTVTPTGGSGSIAIVDAYDDPQAAGDLAWFSLQFGVPLPSTAQFQVVWALTAASSCYGNGYVPTDPTGDWEVEESLDIEWSHAMAPNATIYLVEACSNVDADLQQAVLVAANLVKCGASHIDPNTGALGACPSNSTGAGEISMSWGGDEYAAQTTLDSCAQLDDSCFEAPHVVYVASAGDSPGVEYPSTSPNVVAAGGTTLRRSQTTGNFLEETPWVSAGGGQSAYEARPVYQSSVAGIVGAYRGVPDLSFDADPYTGVWVYDTFQVAGAADSTWMVIGGTSVAAPALAGIINRAGHFYVFTSYELSEIYDYQHITTTYTDIATGYCGFYMGFSGVAGWDFCTGVGVPRGYVGK